MAARGVAPRSAPIRALRFGCCGLAFRSVMADPITLRPRAKTNDFTELSKAICSTPLASTPLTTIKPALTTDRKSTRLNSSHQLISYAVFCLKKKKVCKPAELLDQIGCCTHLHCSPTGAA